MLNLSMIVSSMLGYTVFAVIGLGLIVFDYYGFEVSREYHVFTQSVAAIIAGFSMLGILFMVAFTGHASLFLAVLFTLGMITNIMFMQAEYESTKR